MYNVWQQEVSRESGVKFSNFWTEMVDKRAFHKLISGLELTPFAASTVGQVIMDKNPGVTCVVNKTNTIDSTYRNFKMEVLAGEENMVAKVCPIISHIRTQTLCVWF